MMQHILKQPALASRAPEIPVPTAAPEYAPGRKPSALKKLLAAFQTHMQARRNARAVAHLDDRLLRDVGLEIHPHRRWASAQYLFRRQIWHGPIVLPGDLRQNRRRG